LSLIEENAFNTTELLRIIIPASVEVLHASYFRSSVTI
jgi:hypothetical protein